MSGSNLHYLAFDEIGITVAVIAIACAFIALVWNAVKAIKEWRSLSKKPETDILTNHEDRIAVLEDWSKRAEEKLDGDWKFHQAEIEFNQLILESIKQLIKHELDGNDTEGLEEIEKKLDSYLVKNAVNK